MLLLRFKVREILKTMLGSAIQTIKKKRVIDGIINKIFFYQATRRTKVTTNIALMMNPCPSP